MKYSSRRYDYLVASAIALGIFLPIFFQIKGGIFSDTAMVFDSRGSISRLPIPLSVTACLIGIPLLIGRYRNAIPSLAVVLASVVLMFISLLVTTRGQYEEFQARFILLLQFALPMSALVLGQLYERVNGKMLVLSKVFFIILCAIVLLEIFFSWYHGYRLRIFPPNIYIFSIYQHLQYVPLVFTAGFVMVLFSLGSHNGFRKWIAVFMPIMVFYIVVSAAVNAILLFMVGVLSYVLAFENLNPRTLAKLAGVVILIALVIFGYLYCFRGDRILDEKLNISQTDTIGGITIPGIQERLVYWEFYGEAVTKDMPGFLMGNARPPDRAQYSSAHNYYLDFVYHFGFIPFIPLLVFVGATVYGVFRERKEIMALPELLGITIVVLFLLFVDNMMKVGLRQPYPGIFTFFLWGILISKLSVLSSKQTAET
ncbi:MAG: hypothetical protein KA801_07930 [Syntrophorhabdaceae bacterium]|nr:hypothetical protein [Syntrophorhabdaceae bacterium]